jgi:hypothetical protein
MQPFGLLFIGLPIILGSSVFYVVLSGVVIFALRFLHQLLTARESPLFGILGDASWIFPFKV